MNITAFCCHNSLYGGADARSMGKALARGVHKIELPCGGRLEAIHILKALENGADGVVVIVCPESECGLMEGSARVTRRVGTTRKLMAEAGLEPERLMLFKPERPSAGKLSGILKEARAALEKLGRSPLNR